MDLAGTENITNVSPVHPLPQGFRRLNQFAETTATKFHRHRGLRTTHWKAGGVAQLIKCSLSHMKV